MSEAPPPATWTFRQVLAEVPVRRLWIAQLVSIAGDFLALYGLLSVISFRMHGTPLQVALVSLFYILPLGILGPFGGVLVDRLPARRTMIASDLIRAVLAVGLALAPSLPFMYASLLLISAVSCFFIPAQSVAIRTLVPREGLLPVNALMQQAMQLARLASPAVAGALVALIGPSICFYFDAASFVVSAFLISLVAIPIVPHVAAARSVGAVMADLMTGLRFLFTHSVLAIVIASTALGTFVISCFSPLLAIYLRDAVHTGSTSFGILSAIMTLGMLAATFSIFRLSKLAAPPQLVFAGLAIIGVAIVYIGLVHVAALVAVGTFAMGFGVSLIITPSMALMQQETPVAMMGRVSSSTMSTISISQVLGLLLSGVVAEAIGMRNLFFAAGGALLLLATGGAIRFRARPAPVSPASPNEDGGGA